MAIADTITSMQNHTSNAYTMIGYGTDLTGINKNLENLSSTIFEAFLEALRNPDTLFTNLPKKSGSGAVISLNDTANAPMRIELGSRALEQTTTTGKNKCNLLGTPGSSKISFSGSVLTLNGTFDANTWQGFTAIPLTAGTWTLSIYPSVSTGTYFLFNGVSSSGTNKVTITLSEDTNVSFSVVIIAGTYNNATIKLQIESGSTVTEWEEYTGGIASPNPSYPQDIHSISGSNTIKVNNGQMFDKTNYTNEKYLKTDGTDVTNPSFCYSDYIEVNHNTTYYVSGLANGSGWNSAYCLYDKNKTFIAGYTTSNVTNFSIATTETTRYIRISVKLVDLDTIMFNVGNSALPYKSYLVSQEADIDLGTNLIGLDNQQYKVNLKAGDKIFATNQSNSGLTLQCYTNYGDSTRNDYWSVGANSTRLITLAYDTKAISWSTIIPRPSVAWVNLGSTQLPYSDYIEPINYSKIGNYEDKFIRTSGKNKLNPNVWQNSYITSTGGINDSNQNVLFDYIEVEASSPYKFSVNKALYNISISEFDSSKTFIQRNVVTNISNMSLTTTSTTKYVRIHFNYDNSTTITQSIIDSLEIMFNNGTSILPYEPYGLNEWYIKKNIGKVVLDGSEAWNYSSSSATFYVDIANLNFATSNNVPLSTHYKGHTNVAGTGYLADFELAFLNSSSPSRLYLKDSNYTDTTNYKNWLSSNNVTIDYPLANPEYLPITGTLAEQLENIYKNMLSQEGQTNISQINEDLSFNLNVLAIEE